MEPKNYDLTYYFDEDDGIEPLIYLIKWMSNKINTLIMKKNNN